MQEIIAAAEVVIAAVDQTALAKHLAPRRPRRAPVRRSARSARMSRRARW